jgi:hypothetical protein
MHYLWRRMDEVERQRVWWLYGWFSGLMLCGSCVGAVTWAARMMNLVYFFKGNYTTISTNAAEVYSFHALSRKWRAAYVVTYAIEFLCLSASELMVLDRMSDFAAPLGSDRLKLWAAGGRIVMAVVLLGNAVGLAANIAAAVHFQRISETFSAASSHFATNNTEAASEFVLSSRKDAQLAASIVSVQAFCEVAVLLLIVAAFGVVGVLCARRVISGLRTLDAASETAAELRALRVKVVGTTGFVFVAFLLRSVVSTMLAVANQLQDFAQPCPTPQTGCSTTCFNMFSHLVQWSNYTPEFQLTVILISSPLALLVALWGMTSDYTLRLMKLRQPKTALLPTLALSSQPAYCSGQND